MPTTDLQLKLLLRERHWQKYATFCREFDTAARSIDADLIGTAPSKAQFHRWLSGELIGLPYPDHCRVLEAMFPGWSAVQLFSRSDAGSLLSRGADREEVTAAQLLSIVQAGLSNGEPAMADWGRFEPVARGFATKSNGLDTTAGKDGGDLERIGRRLHMLSTVLRLSPAETTQLARLSGNVVDLSTEISLDIAKDGWTTVSYRHELFNMSAEPLSRIARELWFEHTSGALSIAPQDRDSFHRVTIQRVHDTSTLAKFACRISPALKPGETVNVEYSCTGGRFVDHHYWRQAIHRHTRRLTLSLRHRGMAPIVNCEGTVEYPDGSEHSTDETVIWDTEGSDAIVTLTRDYLRPNQAVTLRWKVDDVAP
jgi:hypothetical protein